jgi:hypothetical protein
MAEAAPEGSKAPSLFIPKTDSLRITSALSQLGQAAPLEVRGRYFSKSLPQPRQRYSYTGIAYSPPLWT